MKIIENGIERDATPEEVSKFESEKKEWLSKDNAIVWNTIRSTRNGLLASSDWTQVNDCPLSSQKKQDWVTYRQALRDITKQGDCHNIIWPTPPQ